MLANWGEQTQSLYKPYNNLLPLSIYVRHPLLPTLTHEYMCSNFRLIIVNIFIF